MTLAVIGAGIGRTGTTSLKVALEMLGLGPCYHMTELLADPSRVGHWEDAWAGRPVDWEAIFDGFGSAVDFPVYRHWHELSERYPEAKVILTVRDPERWYQSVRETIYMASRPGPLKMLQLAVRLPFQKKARQILRVLKGSGVLWEKDFDGRFEDKAHAIAHYEKHVAEVEAGVPRDRLLVYSVKEGWAPLCAFLGVEVPDEPFPRANDRASFLDTFGKGIPGL